MPSGRTRTEGLRAACLGLVALAACGAEESPVAPTPRAEAGAATAAGPEPAAPDRELEALTQLGYAAWDEDADPSRAGITVHDRARVAPGFGLYTNDVDRAWLVDPEGVRVHEWTLAGARRFEHVELLDQGHVLAVSVGEKLARLDRDSRVVWEWPRSVHHDATLDADGSVLVPFWEEPVAYRGRPVRFDALARLDAEGRPIWTWRTSEHLDELRALHPPSRLDTPPAPDETEDKPYFDYYHLNSVQVLPETELGARDPRFAAGNLLVCLRNASLVLVLERDSGKVLWSFGPGVLQLPHMPTLLPGGTVLVFDNGTYRGWSRALEIEPVGGEVVWSWTADPPEAFFSEWRGSCQRLANGNTLICESERGHVFEVTRAGDVVWELWNPELVRGQRKRIYRYLRVSPERAAEVLAR